MLNHLCWNFDAWFQDGQGQGGSTAGASSSVRSAQGGGVVW